MSLEACGICPFPAGYSAVTALSFRPSDNSLWGWAEVKGLIQINLTTGQGTLMLASDKTVGGISWNNESTRLYTSIATNTELWMYNPSTNGFIRYATNLPGPTEALEMRPDGLMMGGMHGATTIYAYDVMARQPVSSEAIPTTYDDVEGIGWPPICIP